MDLDGRAIVEEGLYRKAASSFFHELISSYPLKNVVCFFRMLACLSFPLCLQLLYQYLAMFPWPPYSCPASRSLKDSPPPPMQKPCLLFSSPEHLSCTHQ